MRKIVISDATMKQTSEDFRLTFKEKIELSKLLDRLGVDVIELEGIKNPRIDALQIKSISLAVTDSAIAVPVALTEESVERTFAALKEAKHPRLQVAVPTSAVQIEYIFHMKPDALVAAVEKHHEERYRALLKNVELAEVFSKSEIKVWECRNCGHIEIGTSAPASCAACDYPQSFFEIHAENY